ncbi:MAG: apolipoprotein N-acyltransferase [Spirochaetaceae bacterium]|nr:apolipoprotein N-acyltransferase [Spirochaetaceae bacterium]
MAGGFKKIPILRSFLINTAAILGASLLFAGSFPNPLIPGGIPVLAWVAYLPVFRTIRRTGIGASVFWGSLYGFVSYSLFMPWIRAFDSLAGTAVSLVQLCYMALLFLLLKLALILYPRKGYLLQWLLWLGYEYLRTLGFLGFSYGITGYTQWRVLPVIQIASVFGVWGVSALVVFPSVYGAALCAGGKEFFRRERLSPVLWAAFLALTLAFGLAPREYAGERTAKIALIQQNADPWRGGAAEYRQDLKTLIRLSRAALDGAPDTDLVVWPETAFVPRIYWHINYRDNDTLYPLVKDLMEFLKTQGPPYLIGNDDARLEVDSSGMWARTDYNGALLFEGETIRGVYRKMRLVPFTEYFPYAKTFPRLYRILRDANTHFWKPGTEAAVLSAGKIRFSAPICFEDSFGRLSRDFTRNGAELIVNLSNDAWSKSLSCQMQHLSMAVFRAVENRRSLVRATASGQTCAVDPGGKILAMAEPFTETFLSAEVPLLNARTLYTLWGDLWGLVFAGAAAVVLLIGTIRAILGVIKTGRMI